MLKQLAMMGALAVLCAISVSFSGEQEFIKKPKEKKIYPSCQQYTGLNADIVDLCNQVLKYLVGIQRDAIGEINDYVNGDKECFINSADKKQRADAYAKKMKMKLKLQEILNQLVLITA